MKFFISILLTCIIFFYNGYAQPKTSSGLQPQFLNNIYLVKKDSLSLLERVQAEMKSKAKALGFGGSEGGYFIDGSKSPFRIKAADAMQFMVKLNASMMDPTMMIKLYRFESGKSDRAAVLGGGGGMFNKKKDVGKNVEVACNIQKSGDEIFIISPATKLTAGEYGFLNMMMVTANGSKPLYTVFAFGIDE
jgi:hypothetical protein